MIKIINKLSKASKDHFYKEIIAPLFKYVKCKKLIIVLFFFFLSFQKTINLYEILKF